MSLAAGKDVDVELWVDPAVDRNVHELIMEGSFGETTIRALHFVPAQRSRRSDRGRYVNIRVTGAGARCCSQENPDGGC